MPLQWTNPAPPNDDVRYDHVIAETPLGRIVIEWKSWKVPGESYVAQMPWGDGEIEVVVSNSLDEAKQDVQASWDIMIAKMAALGTTGKELTVEGLIDHIVSVATSPRRVREAGMVEDTPKQRQREIDASNFGVFVLTAAGFDGDKIRALYAKSN